MSDTQSFSGNNSQAINSAVTSALTAADSTTTRAVQNLQLIQQARLNQWKRSAAALSAKYGPDDPRSQNAQQAVTTATALVGKVAMTYQRITAAAETPANGWTVYGHVFNAQYQPAQAYTVFLVDSSNAYYSAAGFAYTDANGYFVLNYSSTPQSQANESSTSARKKAATTAPPDTPSLFIEIANLKGKIIYRGGTAVQPSIGLALYQSVVLPAGEPAIGDPPTILRKTGVPNTKKP